jgi:hypothetical protein
MTENFSELHAQKGYFMHRFTLAAGLALTGAPADDSTLSRDIDQPSESSHVHEQTTSEEIHGHRQ